jgi:hypothetical protein
MSAASDSNGRPGGSEGAEGVLANLPRTRPQRSTARRAAARNEKAGAGSAAAAEPDAPSGRAQAKPRTAKPRTAKPRTAKPTPRAAASGTASKRKAGVKGSSATARKTVKGAKPSTRASTGKRSPSTRRRPVAAADEHVPLQGFESEMDRASGPVEPPGGTELVATAAEMIAEIARAGLSTGERLVRDALARLPLS